MEDYDLFLLAINHAMIYEVGAFWNPNDPDVIEGKIDTREQKRKVGYVNIPQDRGGETKYGIAQNANPEISVKDLNLEQAYDIYYNKYWLKGSCDKLLFPIACIHLDGCINHGVIRANKFLQRAVGVDEDGKIGPQTLSEISLNDASDVINSISSERRNFYNRIVQKNPSQQIFLNGWMRRISEVTEYALSKLE